MKRWRLWFTRAGWMCVLWAASVGALGVAALGMRWLMSAIGMTT